MKANITILNIMTYEKFNDKTGEEEVRSRLEFIFSDKEQLQNSSKYIGFTPIPVFLKGNLVAKLGKDVILKNVYAEFEEIKDFNNPLATRKILKSIKVDNNVVNLL